MKLFIAIAPDDSARYALAESAARLRAACPGRYVDPALYHLTLAFLGETPPEALPRIHGAMALAAAACPRFSLSLGGRGAFGSILWRGTEDSSALNTLAARLREALAQAALPCDPKPFRPHITLARDVRTIPGAQAPHLPGATFPVRAITLYESKREQARLAYLPQDEVFLP